MPKMKTTAEERAMLRDTSVFGVWDESALTVRVIDDIDTLLAERKSLLAENERLKAEIESWRVGVQVAQDILDTRASGYDDE